MRFSNLLSLALLALCLASVYGQKYFGGRADSDYCYSSDLTRSQHVHFATKTAYQLAKGGETVSIPVGCTPSKFWIVNRHGTRLPTASNMPRMQNLPTYQAEIIRNYASGGPANGGLCADDLNLLSSWRWDTNITSAKDGFLTVQGWDDLKGIAQYFKAQFPSLFGEYSEDKYHFRFTESQRTLASFQGFVDGLFGDYAAIPATESTDVLLRPYRDCQLWRDQEDALEEADSELSKFLKSETYQKVIEDVSAKAGYSTALSAEVVETMFEMCNFDLSWNLNENSPWCTLFNLEQAKVFEYAADLEDWYITGPVTTVNKRISCELIQDLLKKLDGSDGPTATAYFSHSSMIQLFLTGLGYTEDQLANPLLGDNYEKMADRTFSTSKNSPLASNVAAVRYDCSGGTKVQFFLNERPLQLSFCTNGLCDWEEVKAKYADFASETCSTYYCSSGAGQMWSVVVVLVSSLISSVFNYV